MCEAFGLEEVVVAPSQPNADDRRRAVARAAASYLERKLYDGVTVAVGLGRNTNETAGFFSPFRQMDCTFVSAMGGSFRMTERINPNDICKVFADRAGGSAVVFYAPAYVESLELRDLLCSQELVAQTLNTAKNADMLVMGVGTVNDDSILVQAGCINPEEAHRLRESGAVSELIGNYLDRNGLGVNSDLDDRLIGVTLKDIQRIPLVVAVASEEEKTMAIYGALRSGIVNVLVTECENALGILKLSGYDGHIKSC